MKFKLCILSAALLFSTGCSAISEPNGDAAAKLESGNRVRLTIQKISKAEKRIIDGLYLVSSKGHVNLPFVGLIKIEGMTVEKAEAAIEETYKDLNIYKKADIKLIIVK